MADSVVHIGENSPEKVALELFDKIANVERRAMHSDDVSGGWKPADREYILSTYLQCIKTVRGYPVDKDGKSKGVVGGTW